MSQRQDAFLIVLVVAEGIASVVSETGHFTGIERLFNIIHAAAVVTWRWKDAI